MEAAFDFTQARLKTRPEQVWVQKKNGPLQWGERSTLYLLMDGSAVHGAAVLGSRGFTATLLFFAAEEPLDTPDPVDSILVPVLKRIESYVP